MDDQQQVATSPDLVRRLQELGREKQLGLGAIILGIIGFLTPLATAQTGGYFGASSEISYGLSQAGFTGVLVVAMAIALGAAPFYLARSRRNDVIAYGVAAAAFGTLASMWVLSFSLPAALAAIGHLSVGFYALVVSFALTAYLGAMRCYGTASE
jgi:hypothetical protein